jgi:mRNA-degrading endonuclease RelE of RelBE toxin-antitoxin system
MNVDYYEGFAKDLAVFPSKIRVSIKAYCILMEEAKSLQEIPKLKKMEGAENLYRAAVTHRYRLLIRWRKETQVLEVKAATSREDAYKK